MLVGRDREERAIEALAAGARVGHSGVLVLVGEPGSGKTTLLDHAAESLHEMAVCRVFGTEAERALAFGGLSQLVGPWTDDIGDLPGPQAAALGIALNLRTGGTVDRLAVGAGTLGLLSHRADTRPLAVLIDDANLLDHSSAEAITFVARRLLADPVLLVAAVRSGEDSPLLRAGLPVRELLGLDAPAARELLSRQSGQQVAPGQADRLVRLTGGNPLALVELGEDLDGVQALGPEGPVGVRTALAQAFFRRTERLSEDAQQALLVAACSSGDRLVVARACRLLGTDPAALAEAVDADLVRGTGTLVFRHPLVRAALVGEADPGRLRAVQAALATATPPEDSDRRAWHLAASVTGPDGAASAALEAVADRARARSAHDVAASALERAGWLSATGAQRADRLLAAAESAWLAGQGERALALVHQAGPSADGEMVARAGHLHGTVSVRTGSVAEALVVLSDAARQVEDSHPDAAVELWADAVNAAFVRGDTVALGEIATRLGALAPRVTTTRSRVLGDLAAGMARTLTGGRGADLIRGSVEHLATSDTLRSDPMRSEWLVLGPLFLREEGRFRQLVHQALAETREAAALGELAHLLLLVALDDATTDRWSRADSEYQESIRLARESGQTTDLALALAGLAWLEARIGRDEACREHAAESLRWCAEKDIVIGRVWAGLALGELELGAGRPADALVHLDGVDQILRETGLQDLDLHPGSDRVEALVRLGRTTEAGAAAEEYHRLSEVKGQAWAMARAERALGMVAADDEAAAHFAAAAGWHADTPDRFETARTSVAHGAWLRRHRRRRDARGLLRSALTTFEELGAVQRTEQAAVELAATGETVQRRGASRLTTLTAQERQIAELLGAGQTTRAAAAALFLSPKTVEYHLRHVYTKLGVRSRSELAQALADP